MKQFFKLILSFYLLFLPVNIFAATSADTKRVRSFAYSLLIQEKLFRSIREYVKHVEFANCAFEKANALFRGRQAFERRDVGGITTLFACFRESVDFADTPEEINGLLCLRRDELDEVDRFLIEPKSVSQETLRGFSGSTNAFLKRVGRSIFLSTIISSECGHLNYFKDCILPCFEALFMSRGSIDIPTGLVAAAAACAVDPAIES